jgi:hypothetical protein
MKINPIEEISQYTDPFDVEDVFTNIITELEKLRNDYVKAILGQEASPNYEEMLKGKMYYKEGTKLFLNYFKFLEEELAFHKFKFRERLK